MSQDQVALITAAVALAIVLVNEPWRLARNVITIVHEAGHALTAVVAGRRLQGIRLHSDTSGLTLTKGKPFGPGMVCTALAGYLAPSLLGLMFAAIVAAGGTTAVLVICALLLLGVLIMVRNAYGVVSIVACGLVLLAVAGWANDPVQAAFAQLVAWFLLFGGLRPLGELQRKRRTGWARDSDVDQLARLTGAPGWFWLVAFVMLNAGSLVLAGTWFLA